MRTPRSFPRRAIFVPAASVAALLLAISCGRVDRLPSAPAVEAVGTKVLSAAKSDDKKEAKNDDKKGATNDDKKDPKSESGKDEQEGNQVLVVTTPPASAEPGLRFVTQPVVEIDKAKGGLLKTNREVTASLEGTTVQLGGTTTIHATNGVATFTDLKVATAGDYTLKFTAPDAQPARVALHVAGGPPAPPPTATLSVTVSGSAGATGTVVSVPSGVNCGTGGPCSADFGVGTVVTLSATPGANSLLSGWTGCSPTPTGDCQVTVNGPTAVTATFVPATFDLSVTVAGDGGVTSSPAGIACGNSGSVCSAPFANGASVTLTALPNGDLVTVAWSGGACSGTALTCTVTMDAAKSVTATFTTAIPTGATLNIAYGGTGFGTVSTTSGTLSCTPFACSGTFTAGSSVVLSAAWDAATDTFAGWGGVTCNEGSASATCTFTMPASTLNMTATFNMFPFAQDADRASAGGMR